MDPPGVRHQCLMLADSESEKTKWVVALNELHRILKKNKLPGTSVGLSVASFSSIPSCRISEIAFSLKKRDKHSVQHLRYPC